jgi:hypothetical protein
MTPITTICLCEIGWNFNELPGKPLLPTVTIPIPIHLQEAVPEVLLSAVQGLKKAKRKEKMKAKKEPRRSIGFAIPRAGRLQRSSSNTARCSRTSVHSESRCCSDVITDVYPGAQRSATRRLLVLGYTHLLTQA